MDQPMRTDRVGSTTGSNGNTSSFEALMATASGTSTHHVGDGRPYRDTPSGGDSGFIPIYSNSDHGHFPSTRGIYGNRSAEWNERRFDDYDGNEESQVNFDQHGIYAQASNSRTYQTPWGLSRSSVGMRIRFGFGGLSIETSMSSMIPSGGGGGRMLMFSSSGGNMFPPFPSFGLMSGRFNPFSSPSSSFRDMMSPHMSSTHLFEQSPFRNDAMYGYPTRSFTNDENYNGPIITELYDDENEEVGCDVNDAKRKSEGIRTNGTPLTRDAVYGYPTKSSLDNEDYDGPIITEIYDDVDGGADDNDVTQKKKVVNKGSTEAQPSNDQAALDVISTVTDDVANDKFEHEENVEQQNHVDSKESETHGSMVNASELADMVGNMTDFETTGIDRVEYLENNTASSVQANGNNDVELTVTCLQPLTEQTPTTVADEMSVHKQAVHTNTVNKPDSRKKRSFRTQSFLHTPLPFEDILIGPNESNRDIPGSPETLPGLEIGSDKSIEINGHSIDDTESIGKTEDATCPTNRPHEDVGNTSMIQRSPKDAVNTDTANRVLSNSKSIEDSSRDPQNDLFDGTSSLDAAEQRRDKYQSDITHSRVSDCKSDDSDISEHEMFDSLNVERNCSHSDLSKSDVLREEPNVQSVGDTGQQIQDDTEFSCPDNEDQLQSLPSSEKGQNNDDIRAITTPLQYQSDGDRQWQYPGQLLPQGKYPTTFRSNVVSSNRSADENGIGQEFEAVYNPMKNAESLQQQQQHQHQWQQTWPQQQQQHGQQQLQHHQQSQTQQQQWQQTWPRQQQSEQQHSWPQQQHQQWQQQRQHEQQQLQHHQQLQPQSEQQQSGHQQQKNQQQQRQQWQQQQLLQRQQRQHQQWHQQQSQQKHNHQQHQRKEQKHSHERQHQYKHCSGHPVENGSRFLSNSKQLPETNGQQKCEHNHVYMYHTNMNGKAYMCLDCGKETHVVHCHCCVHVHQSYEDEQFHPHGNEHSHPDGCEHGHPDGCEHVGPSAESFNNTNATSTAPRSKRNKNATARVNKSSTANSQQTGLHQATNKNDTGTCNSSPESTTKNELDTCQDSPRSTSKNETVTDTPIDDRRYEYPANRSDGLSVLIESVGLQMKDVVPDGNCLFTAITDQLRIRGDFSFTARTLRCAAVEYLRMNPNQDDDTPLFEFLDEHEGSWDEYLNKMSRDGYWGDHIVISALAHVLNRRIIIYRGNEELSSTIVEPRGNVTLNENESTTEESVDATTEADNKNDGAILNEMYLGHVSQSHYVSLRPLDWKDKLMQELKNKSTSCLIGSNPESRTIDSNEAIHVTRCLPQFSPSSVNFLIKYILRGDFLRPARMLYSSRHDHMACYNYYRDMTDTYMFNTRNRRRYRDQPMTFFVSPFDTRVVDIHHEANQKDLIALTEGMPVGKLKLIPAQPNLWKPLAVPEMNTFVVKHADVKQIPNTLAQKGRQCNMLLAFESGWPKDAEEWKSRKRLCGWPDEELVQSILRQRLHVVPAEDVVNSTANTVWEYNFNEAELKLYDACDLKVSGLPFIFKHLIRMTCESKAIITNQHLKAIVFYMCERFTDEDVKRSPATCLLYMINEMKEFLRIGHFPCYFIRGRNLIAGMEYADRSWYIKRLDILKKHLTVCLYFVLDEAGLTGKFFEFEKVFVGLTDEAFGIHDEEIVEDTEVDSNLSYLVPMAVLGVQEWVKIEMFAKAREVLLVWLSDLVQNSHQQELNKEVLMKHVLATLPATEKWLMAFYMDFTDGMNTLEYVCEAQECANISILYGEDVLPMLRKKTAFRNEELLVPTGILLGTKLIQFACKLQHVLLHIDDPEIFQAAFYHFLKTNTHDLLLSIEIERKEHSYTAETQLRELGRLFGGLYMSYNNADKLQFFRDLMDDYEGFCNVIATEDYFIHLTELWNYYGETNREEEAKRKAELVKSDMETYV